MAPDQEERVARISRNPIPLTPVESSQIAAIGHDPETSTLAIRFKPRAGDVSGPLYHYANVDAKLFERFQKAPSIGSFFYATIKPHTEDFPYVRIEAGRRSDDEQQAA